MNIGVMGTGSVGRALAGKLASLGHAVVMGTRDPRRTLAREERDYMGNPPLAVWLADNQAVELGTYAECAAHGEMLVNATNGAASLEALASAGSDNLAGKTLIDISNPLDSSQGMPPSLFVSNTDSLAEQIQRAYPQVKVVKTLNTVTASLMVNPGLVGDGGHSVFLSGNDLQAKARVIALLRSFGWQDIIDLGDITTARGAEMYLPLWLRLWGSLGTPMLNVKVVRPSA